MGSRVRLLWGGWAGVLWGLGIVIGHITSSISTSRPVGLSQHRTTSCRRTVSHCPATPPAAVELSLTALQHHQLPCRRTVSHCPATPPALLEIRHRLLYLVGTSRSLQILQVVTAVELPASLPCNTTSCRRTACLTALQHHQLP
uniref:Uncharacterized protein n=2 Tax=Xenopus tropicalis TaxID=8364 RepID=A0A1B8Y4T0_XENTR